MPRRDYNGSCAGGPDCGKQVVPGGATAEMVVHPWRAERAVVVVPSCRGEVRAGTDSVRGGTVKHKLDIDLSALEMALQTDSYEMRYYLDLETGEILLVMGEFESTLNEVYDEIYDEEGERVVTLEEHLEERDDPEWQKEVLLLADRVRQDHSGRYIRAQWDDPYGDYNAMERFIGTVEDAELRDRLWRAIKGRGAFRYFKDVLFEHPDVREEWFAFKDAWQERRMMDWLEARDIEVVDDEELDEDSVQ